MRVGWRQAVTIVACAGWMTGAAGVHARDVSAGPIWNDIDAKGKCPNVCQQNGAARWSGQWHTLPGTATSVCDCVGGSARPGFPAPDDSWQPAGPLFNQIDAQNKCPGVCKSSGAGVWDGNWKTTEPGRMSVCMCKGAGTFRGAGAGSSCTARGNGGCAGCAVQCGPGQRASCQEGTTANDRMRNGDMGTCVANAQCACR
jgi:mannan-binding protein